LTAKEPEFTLSMSNSEFFEADFAFHLRLDFQHSSGYWADFYLVCVCVREVSGNHDFVGVNRYVE
jgi:hypothetical protein